MHIFYQHYYICDQALHHETDLNPYTWEAWLETCICRQWFLFLSHVFGKNLLVGVWITPKCLEADLFLCISVHSGSNYMRQTKSLVNNEAVIGKIETRFQYEPMLLVFCFFLKTRSWGQYYMRVRYVSVIYSFPSEK